MKKWFGFTLLLLALGVWGCDNCGNSIVEAEEGEECDDGNFDDGDGCSSLCTWEPGYGPQSSTPVDSGTTQTQPSNPTPSQPSNPTPIQTTPVCGNGTVESGEECDDGNTKNGDGCSSSCKTETTSCPEIGSNCSHDSCCNGGLYACENGVIVAYDCNGGSYCDSYDGLFDCVDSCSSSDTSYDMLGVGDCDGEDEAFEYSMCKKGETTGKYGEFWGYFAYGYCTDENNIMYCSNGELIEDSCECIGNETDDGAFDDYCAE